METLNIPIWLITILCGLSLLNWALKLRSQREARHLGTMFSRAWLLVAYAAFLVQLPPAEIRAVWVRWGLCLVLADEIINWLLPIALSAASRRKRGSE